MVKYPVSFSVKPYWGKDEKRRRQFACDAHASSRIIKYINDKMKDHEFRTFLYSDISAELNISVDVVERILFPVDGGHGGITVHNPQLPGGGGRD